MPAATKLTGHIRHIDLFIARAQRQFNFSIFAFFEESGETLGVGGCMEALERTRVGPFSLENSISLDEIKKNVEAQNLSGMLLASSLLVKHLPEIHLEESQLTALCLGQKLKSERPELGLFRVMNAQGRLCAIVENMPEGILKPRKVFGIEGMV